MMDTILCSVDINRPDEQHNLLEVANELALAHEDGLHGTLQAGEEKRRAMHADRRTRTHNRSVFTC